MLRSVIALAVTALVSACASSYVAPSAAKTAPAGKVFALQSQGPDTGKLVITRDEGFFGGGCDYGFFIDGQLAARLAVGELAVFHVPAGEHAIGVGSPAGAKGGFCAFGLDRPKEIEIGLRAGQTKTYRLGHNADGDPSVSPVSLP